MREVEKLVEGRDFKSGWIDSAVYDPRGGTDTNGLCAITIKGQPYGYYVRAETWEQFREEATNSLESEDASTGSAYNRYIKHSAEQDAVNMGAVELPDDLEPGANAPDVPNDDTE